MSKAQDEGMRVLFAGGGSGGHVFPALAVARELGQRGYALMWAGRREGMERDLVQDQGIDYRVLRARPWVGKGLLARAQAVAALTGSVLAARRLILGANVSLTIGTGGYVSAPAIIGSYLARRPVLLLEPNAQAGAANRWLSRLSAAACTGYETTGEQLSCRSYWTGVPVRREFFEQQGAGVGEPCVLIVGGSQGARQINELLPPVLERLAKRVDGLTVVHQVGEPHLSSVADRYRHHETGAIRLDLVPFIADMAAAMRRAQVVISRAGALTLAEIVASGRPSILIPLAGAGGHQRANAERLEAAGAALVVDSSAASVERLETALIDLLQDHEKRQRMAAAAKGLARADATERIADLAELLGRAA